MKKWSNSEWHWSVLYEQMHENLLASRALERKMHEAGIPLPPKNALVALAEQAMLGNVQVLPPKD